MLQVLSNKCLDLNSRPLDYKFSTLTDIEVTLQLVVCLFVCLFVFGDFVRFICRVVYVAVVVHVVVETFKIVVVFFNFC